MESRSATLRRRHRRIFRWSMGLAVVAHGLVFFFGPWFQAEPLSGGGTELVEGGAPVFGGLAVNVHFGPPGIVSESGSLSQEPDWRILSASRVLPAPVGCKGKDWVTDGFGSGEVQLSVGDNGRPDEVVVSESSGDRCWDGLMVGLASDLLYRWLPSPEFPAPVDLFQPVTVSLTGY